MLTLSDSELMKMSGGIEEGTICGLMIGATIGSWLLFGPLAGSLVFMFTPSACALDYVIN
jgi:hypothetical protein